MRKLVVLLAVAGLFGLAQPGLAASDCCPGTKTEKVEKEAKKERVKKDCDDKAKAECADKAEKKAEDCK